MLSMHSLNIYLISEILYVCILEEHRQEIHKLK